jgi:hypothetical protein
LFELAANRIGPRPTPLSGGIISPFPALTGFSQPIKTQDLIIKIDEGVIRISFFGWLRCWN